MFDNLTNVFLQFTRTFALTAERWLYLMHKGGMAKRLQYYIERGSSETPKSDYVIYGWPLKDKKIKLIVYFGEKYLKVVEADILRREWAGLARLK